MKNSEKLLLMYQKAKYPNLLAEHLSGWCDEALARGASVSTEIMKAVLQGQDDLSLREAIDLCRYTECDFKYLFASILSTLDKKNEEHQQWISDLMDDLSRLSAAAKDGNTRAIKFMTGHERTRLVNLELDLINKELVTYAEYRRVKQNMEFACYEAFGYPDEVAIRTVPLEREEAL